jgi:lysozyme family protein
MESNFAKSLTLVLKSEGGNDDDPLDHGGRTSRGITQREYDAWCVENNLPKGDVWKATTSSVSSIYHDEYWNPYCGLMPVGLDYLYFDMAVNAGPARAMKLLQQALQVTPDGRFGPVTRQALKAANPSSVVESYTAAKIAFYKSLHQPRFLKGWLSRCASVKASAIKMV